MLAAPTTPCVCVHDASACAGSAARPPGGVLDDSTGLVLYHLDVQIDSAPAVRNERLARER